MEESLKSLQSDQTHMVSQEKSNEQSTKVKDAEEMPAQQDKDEHVNDNEDTGSKIDDEKREEKDEKAGGDGMEINGKPVTETPLSNKDGSGDNEMISSESKEKTTTSGVDGDSDESKTDKKDDDTEKTPDNDDDAFDTDFSNPESLDGPGRSKLFERARQFEQKGKKDHALNCYLGCLTGLSASNQFPMLPQCLHQIADIYFEKEEYEKAVQFIQAEKLYYETALVDVTQLKQKFKENQSSSDDGKDSNDIDSNADREEVLKAEEFQNLSKLCLQEGNTQLALEYCGKATKILQSVYGESHQKTIQALDLFTVIYAEVGKQQYADAMKKFEKEESRMREEKAGSASKESENTEQGSSLRYRGKEKLPTEDTDRREGVENLAEPQVEFEPPEEDEQHDDFITTLLMMIAFFLLTVILMLLICYVYCSFADRSPTCANVKSELTYFYMKLKYHYYYYFKSNQGNTYM
ncbi:protein starmaker-like [Ptychodera flava]|uniref:protein starmaker-like n=1 Tax=Ptychodera flava TaxID=63121 RepID=UPI00396AA282